jgi:hypothetical protein
MLKEELVYFFFISNLKKKGGGGLLHGLPASCPILESFSNINL